VINLASIDDQLDKAFDLACFIQRDRNAAVRIVTQALAKLEVAVTTQGKRLYYKPAGRPSYDVRYRIDLETRFLSAIHIFSNASSTSNQNRTR
jgi:hypothetical protein